VGSYPGPLFCYTGLYGSVIQFEVGYCYTSSIVLFASIVLAIPGLLCFQMNFRVGFLNLCDESHWDFDGNCIDDVDFFW
jgi:hypothetical protein